MFNIQSNSPKTYTGISLDFIKTTKQAAAFLCGFIDGDGSLCKNGKIYKIECHKSWLETLIQKKIVIYDNDKAGRKLMKVGDYSYTVPSGKDANDLTPEEAKVFLKDCLEKSGFNFEN
jgi:hypothetical protein